MIFGYCDVLEFTGEGFRALEILSHYPFDMISTHKIKRKRIENSFLNFFVSRTGLENNNFNVITTWNLKSPFVKESFNLVYGSDLEGNIFMLIQTILRTCLKRKYNFKTIIKDSLALNFERQEPIRNYDFSQNLITKLLISTIKDFEGPEALSGILLIPVVISSIIEEFGLSQDWPNSNDLLQIKDIFDANGHLNFLVYWILANFPKLFNMISKELAIKTLAKTKLFFIQFALFIK